MLNFDDFNPDGFSGEWEYKLWLDAIDKQRVRLPVKRGVEVRMLRNYLWNALTAFKLRKAGRIQRAREYELVCDRIHRALPDRLKW
jgi:hypothetical protein